jgi:CBS domain-containing protein
MSKSLFELDLAPGKVVSVSHRATLKDCFTAIMGYSITSSSLLLSSSSALALFALSNSTPPRYKISGVAVLDEGGRLVGTISASDLKVCASINHASFIIFLHNTTID